MQKFEFLLKNEKQKLYHRLTLFILFFNLAAISWLLFSSIQPAVLKISGSATLLLLLLTILLFRKTAENKRKDLLFIATAILTVSYWAGSGYWWMGILIASIYLLHFITKRKLIVRFYPDKILYPSFPERVISWNELSNVVLKDEWLTIDFKNNRIIQQFTEETIPAGNEKEFNDFCRQLLNS